LSANKFSILSFIFISKLADMKGISFVTNDENKKVAVLIDLKEHGDLWEDFYDGLIAEQRKDDDLISLDQLKQELKNEGRL
jgi:hypothetical protein